MRFGMGALGLGQTFATTVANSDGSTTPVDSTVNNPTDLSNVLAAGSTGVINSAAACGAGWSIVINSSGQPICQENASGCSSTIVPGTCDTTIYLAVAAVAVMFGLAMAAK
jgi:hypothetical protein